MGGVATSVDQALAPRDRQWHLRVEVLQDDGVTWLDLTDKVVYDRRLSGATFTAALERGRNTVTADLTTLAMQNADRFWNQPPPAGIATWNGRPVRLALVTRAGVDPWRVVTISNVSTNLTATATLTLDSLDKKLLDQRANQVTFGGEPYADRTVGWLMQQLYATAFPPAVVQTWVDAGCLQRLYDLPTADGSRGLSGMGRKPGYDGTVWHDDNLPYYGHPMVAVDDVNAGILHQKIAYAAGGQLWLYDPVTGQDTLVKKLTDVGLSASYQIFHLLYCANTHRVIVIAWEPDIPGSGTDAARDRSGAKSTGPVRFLRSDGTTGGTGLELFNAPTLGSTAIYTGHFAVRVGGFSATNGVGAHGSNTNDNFGANCPFPIPQWTRIRQASPVAFYTMQWAQWNNRDTTGDGRGIALSDASSKWAGESGGGWEAYNSLAAGTDRRPLDFAWNCGQHRGAFAVQHSGVYLAFFTIDYDSTNKVYHHRLWRLDCSSATGAPTYQYYDSVGLSWVTSGGTPWNYRVSATSGGTQDVQPYAVEFSPDDTKILLGGAIWKETPWTVPGPAPANSVIGILSQHTFSTPPTGVVQFDSSGTADPCNWTGALADLATCLPIAIVANTNNANYLAITFLNYATNQFTQALLYTNTGTTTDRWNKRRTSVGVPMGVCFDATRTRFYWLESGANQVWSVIGNSITTDPTVEDNGLNPIDQDRTLQAGLVYHAASDALYGISGPGTGTQANPEVAGAVPTGKNAFWRLSNVLADWIEWADFGDDDVATIMEELALRVDALRYFDDQGRGCLTARPWAGTPVDGTLVIGPGAVGTEIEMDCDSVDFGFDQVINKAEVIPYAVVLSPPSPPQLNLATRPANFGRALCDSVPEVQATTSRKAQLYLQCAQGGTVGAPDDGVIGRVQGGAQVNDTRAPFHRLRFRYLLVAKTIESQLLASVVAGGVTIRVPHDHVVNLVPNATSGYGDVAEITDPATNTPTLFTITAITDVPAGGYADLTINPALPANLAVNTPVVLSAFAHNRWSDNPAGVTLLNGAHTDSTTTLTVDSTSEIALFSVVRVDAEDMRVTAILSATTLTVVRGVGNTLPAAHADNAPVLVFFAPLERDDVQTSLTANITSSTTSIPLGSSSECTVGAQLLIEGDLLPITGIPDATHVTVTRAANAAAHSSGVPVRCISPYAPGTWFAIGATGVSLRFTAGNPEKPFIEGDAIEIVLPGKQLQQQTHAVQTAYNQASIDRLKALGFGNGIRVWSGGRTCRFASQRVALEMAKRLVSSATGWGDPRFGLKLRGRLRFKPVLGQVRNIRSPQLLPTVHGSPNGDATPQGSDTARTIAAYIARYGVTPDSDALQVECVPLNPHRL